MNDNTYDKLHMFWLQHVSNMMKRKKTFNRLMKLPPDTRKLTIAEIIDPLELWALYEFGDGPAFRKPGSLSAWMDQMDANGDNMWTFLLEKLFKVPRAETRAVPTPRLYFAAHMVVTDRIYDYDFEGHFFDNPNAPYDDKSWGAYLNHGYYPKATHLTVSVNYGRSCTLSVPFHHKHFKLERALTLIAPFLETVTEFTYRPENARHILHVAYSEQSTLQWGDGQRQIMCLLTYAVLEAGLTTTMERVDLPTVPGFEDLPSHNEHERTITISTCVGCGVEKVSRLCGGCNKVGYCSEKCTDVHWEKEHHSECQ